MTGYAPSAEQPKICLKRCKASLFAGNVVFGIPGKRFESAGVS